MKQYLLPDPQSALAAIGDVPSVHTAADLGMMARQEGYICLSGLQPNGIGTWLDYENNMNWRVLPLIPNHKEAWVDAFLAALRSGLDMKTHLDLSKNERKQKKANCAIASISQALTSINPEVDDEVAADSGCIKRTVFRYFTKSGN